MPAVHHNIGLMLMRLGRFGEAIQPFIEALRLDPDYRNARYTSVMPTHDSVGMTRRSIPGRSFLNWCPAAQGPPQSRVELHVRGTTGRGRSDRCAELPADRRLAGSEFPVHGAGGTPGVPAIRRRGAWDPGRSHRRLNTAVWPYPVVAYMRGELTADRLMEIAATNDQKTEAHTYVGMDLLLKGRVQDAREHFVWVPTTATSASLSTRCSGRTRPDVGDVAVPQKEPTRRSRSLRDVGPIVTRVHAASRSPARRRSQPAIRFQLANVRVTILDSDHSTNIRPTVRPSHVGIGVPHRHHREEHGRERRDATENGHDADDHLATGQ